MIQTVKELCSIGLIKKRSVRKKDGSQSDNHYKVVTLKQPRIRIGQKKGRSRLAHSFFQSSKFVKPFYNIILNQKAQIVKFICYISFPIIPHFLSPPLMLTKFTERRFKRREKAPTGARGSPKICSSLYSTHLYSNRSKKRLTLYSKYRCNLGRQNFSRNTHGCASTRRKSIHMGKVRSNQRTQLVRPPPRHGKHPFHFFFCWKSNSNKR